uniref:PCI domain-containing protein n=1 Tax=Dendroctonus ponderosae TaxID=77166 RepID=A0AAR5PZD1_DENPD
MDAVQEDVQMDRPANDNDDNDEGTFYVVENPSTILDDYVYNYLNTALYQRLAYIADCCPPLRLEILEHAVFVTSRAPFVYQFFHHRLAVEITNAKRLQYELPPLDTKRIKEQQEKSASTIARMENSLRFYEKTGVKACIYRIHNELAEHYMQIGNICNALKWFLKAQDYCVNAKQVISTNQNLINIAVFQQDWSRVLSYVTKTEQTPGFREELMKDEKIFTLLKCAAGVAQLSTKNFKAAAHSFLQTCWDCCEFSDIVSPGDVAIYGGLCALATFNRSELHYFVIINTNFREILEDEPPIREAILNFYQSRFPACKQLLDRMRGRLLLDIYLAPHVSTLYAKIRSRGLVQYCIPYVSVDIRRMAQTFDRTVPAIEEELVRLILDGQIEALIDSVNKVLYAKKKDPKKTALAKGLAVGKEHLRSAQMLVLRVAMLKSGIEVQSPVEQIEDMQVEK